MICATRALKAGPTRIGRLGVALPRPVTITTLLGVGAGLIFGVIVAAIIAPSLKSFIFTASIGSMAGWLVVNYSPLQGESLAKWLGLSVRSLTKRRYIEGKPVIVCVGIAEVDRMPRGSLYLRRGSVRVPAQSYDDRGVLLAHQRNIASAIDVGDPEEGRVADTTPKTGTRPNSRGLTAGLAAAGPSKRKVAGSRRSPETGGPARSRSTQQADLVADGLPPVTALPKDKS